MSDIPPYYTALILKYKEKGILLDTNILLLLLVGLCNPSYIKDCKRIKKYTEDDFRLLLGIVKSFSRLIVTPHILAEVSNFSDKMFRGKQLPQYFSVFVKNLTESKESYHEKKYILKNKFLPKVGVADVSMFILARNKKYLVITGEGPLTNLIRSQGFDVVRFEELI